MLKSMFRLMVLFGVWVMYAASPANAAGGSGSFLVTKIIVEGDRVYIFGSGIQNPDQCSTSNYAVIMPSAANVDRFLSVAMTAMTSQRRISLWFVGCVASNWDASAPYAITLELQQGG